jgi:hypothetical protein
MKAIPILRSPAGVEPLFELREPMLAIVGWVMVGMSASAFYFHRLVGPLDGAFKVALAAMLVGFLLAGLRLALRRGGASAAARSFRRDPLKWLGGALFVGTLTALQLAVSGAIVSIAS